MSSESFPCDLVSWERSYTMARLLAEKIKSSAYWPDLVIAIGRGGYIPARVVCDFMLFDLLTSIKVEHWGVAAQKKDQAEVRFPLSVDVSGKKVLIVDDITDTGDTLKTAVNYVGGLGATEIRTAVLQHKISSLFQPNYYGEKITVWKWVIYPWAAHEDIVGFAERVLCEKPLSAGELSAELKRRYQIELKKTDLDEILKDLLNLGKANKQDSIYKYLNKI